MLFFLDYLIICSMSRINGNGCRFDKWPSGSGLASFLPVPAKDKFVQVVGIVQSR